MGAPYGEKVVDMSTALITGASSGIGETFARTLAARGHDLVLVARDTRRLEDLAIELRERSHVVCEVVTADLSDRSALKRVEDRLGDRMRPIDVLINSAGFALKGRFVNGDVEAEQSMIDVMVTAVMRLTHAVVPNMVARGHGTIINVSSIGGWMTGSTYNAAKAWVTTFSEGLAPQVADSGVRVMALCPGFTRTEFQSRADIREDTIPEWLWLEVDVVVNDALADVARGRLISIPSNRYKALSYLLRYAPRPLVRRATGARTRGRRRTAT